MIGLQSRAILWGTMRTRHVVLQECTGIHGTKVKLPMLLKMDNKGAVDLANNWSVGGQTRHVNVRQCFLRELKETKIMDICWIKGSENDADVITKNLDRPAFEKFIKTLVGQDVYMKNPATSEQGGCQKVSDGT